MSDISSRKTYCIVTFGCQMNVHDSEKLSGVLRRKGLEYSDDPQKADIVVFNTCSVRLKAEEKFYTALGRLKRSKEKNEKKIIIVAGCTAQASADEIFKRAPYVDIIIGPRSLDRILENISALDGNTLIDTDLNGNVFDQLKYDSVMDIYDRPSPVRAYVTIMEGCNNFCSYCIVPYTRGREIYRDKTQILNEIRFLADKGYLEIILLGQNVNAYKNSGYGFADLLADVARVGGIQRVRFVTSHPAFLDERTIKAMAEYDNICPQLHLPLQSGSDVILKAMNRKYTLKEYIDKINNIKYNIKNVSLSSDFIIGFPGEADKDFNNTMEAVREIEYDQIFSFVYSTRPYTPASNYKDDVPLQIKKERLQALQNLQGKIQLQKNKNEVGKILETLVDGFSKKESTVLSGRTVANKIVNFEGPAELMNTITPVKIISASQNSLRGIL